VKLGGECWRGQGEGKGLNFEKAFLSERKISILLHFMLQVTIEATYKHIRHDHTTLNILTPLGHFNLSITLRLTLLAY